MFLVLVYLINNVNASHDFLSETSLTKIYELVFIAFDAFLCNNIINERNFVRKKMLIMIYGDDYLCFALQACRFK